MRLKLCVETRESDAFLFVFYLQSGRKCVIIELYIYTTSSYEVKYMNENVKNLYSLLEKLLLEKTIP